MNQSPTVANSLLAMLTATAQRALSIGASAAGLVIWALVPGYVYYATYLYVLGAPWALGMLGTTSIGAAGFLVLALLLVNVLAVLFFRFTVAWSRHLLNVVSVSTGVATVAIALGVLTHWPWLSGTVMHAIFGMSMILGTAATITAVIHRAATDPLTVQQKIAAAICVPGISVLFAALMGSVMATADIRRGTETLPEARFDVPSPKAWRVLMPLGDRLLLVTGPLKGPHAFRVVAATDVKELAYPD